MGDEATAPSFAEKGIAFVVLFLATGAIVPLWRLGGGEAAGLAGQIQVEGDAVQQRVWLVVFVLIAGLVARHRRDVLRAGGRITLLWMLPALAAVSTAWSSAPALTFRRSVLLLGATTFGVYLAGRFRGDRLVGLLAAVLAAIALLSLVAALFLPAYGVEHGLLEGDWRGVFAQKNRLGWAMVLGTAVWVIRILYDRGRLLVNTAFLGLSVALLILSDSKTSLVVLAVVLAAVVLLRMMQVGAAASGLALVGIGVACPAGVGWLLRNYESLLAGLGRDATLTGRTEYWTQALVAIEQSPILGYGYAAFWRGLEGPSADFVLAFPENPTHSHNGLLELWLVLGLVGVLLFLATLMLNLWRILARLGERQGIDAAFPVLFLVFLVSTNITETDIMTYNSLTWMLYSGLSVQLAPPRIPAAMGPTSAGAHPAVAPVPIQGRSPR